MKLRILLILCCLVVPAASSFAQRRLTAVHCGGVGVGDEAAAATGFVFVSCLGGSN